LDDEMSDAWMHFSFLTFLPQTLRLFALWRGGGNAE
jgi:hypothetical protein